MTHRGIPRATLPQSLHRLRLRLTAWYSATFFAILALLGVGMFAAITRQYDRDLDASLRDASSALVRAVRAQAASNDRPFDLSSGIRIPDRTLYLTDTLGRPVGGPAPDWIERLARAAGQTGQVHATRAIGSDRVLRVYAQRFAVRARPALVAVAAADEIELEDKYAALIAWFGLAALVAVVLVAGGGWLLARQSTAPVERAIAHMRRFMADAAHELRTPLTVVRSQADVALQRRREPEHYIAALRSVERETGRLGRIVEDLLMLARADAGERPLDLQRVFLDDVTLDAADALRIVGERRGVRVEVESFEEAPVRADALLLRQLVMILLDNAIKYTSSGGVVRVDVRREGPSAMLTVSDNGIGIGPEQLPHVFERFYRGDPSRKRGAAEGAVSEGAGLGLSIAEWIAEEHTAAIRIRSQPGQGTRVSVQFPLIPPLTSLSSS